MERKKTRMNESQFEMFLEGLRYGFSEEKLSICVGIYTSIAGWCIRCFDRHGPEHSHQMLVLGQYPKYTQEELNRIAANHFRYGIGGEELEVAFGTTRHKINRRIKNLSEFPDKDQIEPLPLPVFTISYKKLMRANIPLSVIYQIEKGILSNLNSTKQQNILEALYQGSLSEHESELLDRMARQGQQQVLLIRLKRLAQAS